MFVPPPPPLLTPHFYFPLELYVYITLTNNYLAFFIYQLIILWTISINWHRWLLLNNHTSKYNSFILVLYRRYKNHVSVCPPTFWHIATPLQMLSRGCSHCLLWFYFNKWILKIRWSISYIDCKEPFSQLTHLTSNYIGVEITWEAWVCYLILSMIHYHLSVLALSNARVYWYVKITFIRKYYPKQILFSFLFLNA